MQQKTITSLAQAKRLAEELSWQGIKNMRFNYRGEVSDSFELKPNLTRGLLDIGEAKERESKLMDQQKKRVDFVNAYLQLTDTGKNHNDWILMFQMQRK